MEAKESELTNWVKGLDIEGNQEITYDKRDKLLHFNTDRYWHCYYDIESKKLYNQYCQLLMDNGYDYLLRIGMIDKDEKGLKYFEELTLKEK